MEGEWANLEPAKKTDILAEVERINALVADANAKHRAFKGSKSSADGEVFKTARSAANTAMKNSDLTKWLAEISDESGFAAVAQEFEDKLGPACTTSPAAIEAAEEMCSKINDYIKAREKEIEGHFMAQYVIERLYHLCGTDPDKKKIAGSVGQDIDRIKAVISSGNIRTRATLIHNFYEYVLVDGAADGLNSGTQDRLKEIGQGGDAYVRRLESFNLDWGELDKKKEGGKSNVDESPSSGAMGRGNQRTSREGDEPGQEPDSTTKTSQSKLKGNQEGSKGEPLTQEELDFLEIGREDALPWGEGQLSWLKNEADDWVIRNRFLGMPLRAGASGHTRDLANAAKLLNVSQKKTRAMAIAYLLPIGAHTLVEVAAAMKTVGGIGYIEGREIYTPQSLQGVGTSVLESCRGTAPDGTRGYPHELAPPKSS